MATPETHVETATLEHARALAPLLRPEDVAEVVAAGYANGLEAVEASVREAEIAWAVMVRHDGQEEVAALYGARGIGRASMLTGPEVGEIWFLTGRRFPKHPRAMMGVARLAMKLMLRSYPVLFNVIDARYEAAVRWARWLGFTVWPALPYGPQGLPFHLAVIHRR